MLPLRRGHPLLGGCRLFYKPDQLRYARNLGEGGGPDGTLSSSGLSLVARYSPGHTLLNAGAGTVDFGTPNSLGLTGPGVTVIARVRVGLNAAGSGSSTTYTLAESIAAAAASGFSLFWNQNGFTNYGFNFGVYKSGDYYIANALGTNQLGRDAVVAGVYEPATKTPKLYVDGKMLGTNLISSSGTPTAITWDVSSSNPLYLGYNSVANNLVGEIAWVMVFNRPLSVGEIRVLSDDHNWPFFEDDEFMLSDGTATYVTTVGAGQAFSGQAAGPVTYGTPVDALAYVGGDLTIDPSSTGPVTYTTGISVGDPLNTGSPELALYRTSVGVASDLTQNSTVRYTTEVGVGQKMRSLIDGRLDLLGTARYRR